MGDEPRLPPVDEVQALRAAACDWRLARGDLGVFAVILEHCNAEGESFPGPALIAKKARLAVTNVKGCIQRLEALRYIEVVRPGLRKKNRFKVTFKPLHILPRDRGMPSQLKREVARQKANSSREHSQSKRSTTAPTGDTRMHSTGHARMNQLGIQVRQEVAFKSLNHILKSLALRALFEVLKSRSKSGHQKKRSGSLSRHARCTWKL
jgi:hypothetical protein